MNPEPDATAQLHAAADDLWARLLETSPLIGTFIGDPTYDDRMPRIDEDGREREGAMFAAADAAVAGIDAAALEPTDRDTLAILQAIVARGMSRLTSRYDRYEVSSHLDGAVSALGVVASVQRADSPEALDRYEARLRDFGRYLDEATGLAREGVAAGVVPPRVIVERTVAQVERILGMGVEGSPAMAPAQDDAARERLAGAVRDVVLPAHERFGEAIRDEVLPAAPETIGLAALPGGDELYRSEIVGWTTLALDPQDVHRIGTDRFAAIAEERRTIAAGLGYASAAEAIEARTAAGENGFASVEELLAAVEDQVARSWEAAPAWFGRLPSTNCAIRRVEEFREADQPFAFYNPPTEDGSRPGTYYVNGYALEQRARHQVPGVTFHEANPGHHFQITLEQEMPDRHPLRRYGGFMVGAAFAEGWGLYAERLADEMGLYLDEWERLGMLENQALRAARLVTDTGIHALGWTREQAVALLRDGGQSPSDAAIEVDRYISVPGQALCYTTGMIEIERAREKAEADGRPLRDFHDDVLAHGSLPLSAFRRAFGTD
ncbi:MAG TPA: DUF885 domain-containing protein [Actinomycetota bacterium]